MFTGALQKWVKMEEHKYQAYFLAQYIFLLLFFFYCNFRNLDSKLFTGNNTRHNWGKSKLTPGTCHSLTPPHRSATHLSVARQLMVRLLCSSL